MDRDDAFTAEVMGPFKKYGLMFIRTDSDSFYVRIHTYEGMKTKVMEVGKKAMTEEVVKENTMEMKKNATAEEVMKNATEVGSTK